ncbi:AAA family ATPase [Pannus brasiliensis CCIBt3594]|uniref:AAA family ATPase n=1 Tax=Pannus brasiliensis CCIBt3594 TaxID=1427578 RepID=A0AAW9QS46_9CHRO
MVQKIAFFNPKGGVSKTTTTFNLGWMLAEKGKRVILVDADPQCNLTGMTLGEETEADEARLEEIYKTRSNIKTGLAPAFEVQPRSIEAVDCIPIKGRDGLFLLPGHVGLAEYEVTLGIAQELSGSIRSLRNLPGAIPDFFEKTARKLNVDYILIDTSSSLGSLNQNILMTSDFFIVPTTADFLSILAIESLARILPKWYQWAKKANSLTILKEANYPFPDVRLHFLGTIVQDRRMIQLENFDKWVQRIESIVTEKLVAALEKNNMMFTKNFYFENQITSSYTLARIPDSNDLVMISQIKKTPIFALAPEQLSSMSLAGNNLAIMQEKQKEFQLIFSDLADKVIGLTSTAYAVST